VLHLATHGFVMGEGCMPVGGGAARTSAVQALASNPLLGAGLVLAGASRRSGRSTAADDGILTAEEISGLDLSGIDWAVLSACDSGTGVTRAGEGIFGLRRAFQIAGVRTVIVSLWPVEDRLARSWMETLYSARLTRHRSTDAAVREASRSALADRRRLGGSTHPLYWSGFVAAGDWR
jgi:CHAT domain-containing protein